MRIVETDNFGGDYPDESFVNLPPRSIEQADYVCAAINKCCSGETARRFWMVFDNDYILQPGFEP